MKINFHARYGEFSEKKHIKPAPPNPPKSVMILITCLMFIGMPLKHWYKNC